MGCTHAEAGVNRLTPGAAPDTAFAGPKSIMRGVGLPSTSTTNMFAGFKSR